MLTEVGVKMVAISNDGLIYYFHLWLGFLWGFQSIVYLRFSVVEGMEVSDVLVVRLVVDVIGVFGDQCYFVWVHLYGFHVLYDLFKSMVSFEGYVGEVYLVDQMVG